MDIRRWVYTRITDSLPTGKNEWRGLIALLRDEPNPDVAYIALDDGSGVVDWEEISLASHTHPGGGSTIIVQEGGVEVDPGVTTLNFDASDFTVTESPEDTVTLGLAYGTGAGTPAEGNHTHANDHVAATVVDSTSIDLTLAGQQITAAAIFGSGAGTVAEGNHTHASTLIVQEGGVTTDATVGTINFDASDFNLTESPEDTVSIALAYGTGAGTPAEGNHTHANPGVIVQEGDSTVDAAATTLDFDSTDFVVTSSPAGEANVSLQLRNPFHKTYKNINANQGLTTASVGGTVAPTLAATVSNQDDADGPWIQHLTGSVSGNTSSVQSGSGGSIRADWDPNIGIRIKTPATITSIRLHIGLYSSTPAGAADPTLHGIGYRFDTGAGDANWQLWRNDNSGGGAVTSSGIAVAANTVYDIWLNYDVAAVGWNCLINSTYTGFITTNIPGITTPMAWGIHVTTLTAAGRSIKWSHVNITHE